MHNNMDDKRLVRLINDLHLCTGIRLSWLNSRGEEVYTSSNQADFCRLIHQERLESCHLCDRNAVDTVLKTRKPYRYLCHAGLYEVAIPVLENDELIAIILFGQMLDDTPREEQWKRILQKCYWEKDTEGLHQTFLRLRQISYEQMEACAEIARTCVNEVRLRSMSNLNIADDASRLRQYIETHYADRLDAESLALALHMGTTKLYSVCRQRYHKTPMQLLMEIRIQAAMELLRSTKEHIGAIAQAVGYENQNYFTKVFRKATGLTPLAWRSENTRDFL